MSFDEDLARGQVLFRFGDDGGGIDWERLAVKARRAGLPADSRADLEAALFANDVSTRDDVTETSGRGVGMGAVLACVEACGGTIAIETETGRGTTWQFAFPASMLVEPAPGSSQDSAASSGDCCRAA